MLIGLMGKAGSGKDTFADLLVEEFGFTKIALADHMKRIVREVFDFSDAQLWGPSENRGKPDTRYPNKYGDKPLTPRFALQTLGDWGRDCYPSIWVDLAINGYLMLQENPEAKYASDTGFYAVANNDFSRKARVVIPDVRYRLEMEKIQEAGGEVIKLFRPGISKDIGGIPAHSSEVEQDSIKPHELKWTLTVPEGIPQYHKLIREVIGAFIDRMESPKGEPNAIAMDQEILRTEVRSSKP